MSRQFTHVIETFPERPIKDGIKPIEHVLSRWATGEIIGVVRGTNVGFVSLSEERTKQVSYRDEKFALMALRKHADEDARVLSPQSAGAVIDEVDGTKRIISPYEQ